MQLLHDQVFRCTTAGGAFWYTLPAVLTQWSRGVDLDLADLRAHQRAPVETTLALLAAHALEVAAVSRLPEDEATWRNLLQGLAEHEGAPHFWQLVHTDTTSAAFLQPALTDPALLTRPLSGMPELDTLVRAKNHDVKQDTDCYAGAADWVYALITLQTSVGYVGRGNYGVTRMNGPYGSRVYYAAYYDDTPSGRFRQDVYRLLTHWSRMHEDNSFGYRRTGLRLTAAQAWDGQSGLALADLHPGYVEVARIVRLEETPAGGLGGRRGLSSGQRIAGAKPLRGSVGDPWTPLVRPQEGGPPAAATGLEALPTSKNGLSWGDFLDLAFRARGRLPSPFGIVADGERPVTLRLCALARDKDGTCGYHEFAFTLPPQLVVPLCMSGNEPDAHSQLLRLQQCGVREAKEMADRLRDAYCLAQLPIQKGRTARAAAQQLRRAKPQLRRILTTQRAEFEAGWQARLLPWLVRAITSGAPLASALDGWVAALRQQAEDDLRRRLPLQFDVGRRSPLALAKALAALPPARLPLKA